MKLVEQNILPGIWETKILFPSKLNCFQISICLLCSFLIEAKSGIDSLR